MKAAFIGALALSCWASTLAAQQATVTNAGPSNEGSFLDTSIVFPRVVVCGFSIRVKTDPGWTHPSVTRLDRGTFLVADPRERVRDWVRIVGTFELFDEDGNLLEDPEIIPLDGWGLGENMCDFVPA